MPIDLLLRSEKGTALTHTELDQNFQTIQDAVNASRPEIVTIASAAHTIGTNRVVLVDATAQAITVTLPDPTTINNQIIYVKKIDSSTNTVTVVPNSIENIDGNSSVVLGAQWEKIQLISDGANWFIL